MVTWKPIHYHGDGFMNNDIVYVGVWNELGLSDPTQPLLADMNTNMMSNHDSL